MRAFSVLKVVSLAAAVGLLSSLPGASAMAMKLPPGACAFHKKVFNAGTMCSYQCDPATQACSQQMCVNGQWTQIISCVGPFCTQKCG